MKSPSLYWNIVGDEMIGPGVYLFTDDPERVDYAILLYSRQRVSGFYKYFAGPVETPALPEFKECIQCQKKFPIWPDSYGKGGYRNNREYCNAACRQKAYRERVKAEERCP